MKTNIKNKKFFKRTKKGNNKMFRRTKKGKMHGGEPTTFKENDLVFAKWLDRGTRDLNDVNTPYYNAKITKKNDDGTYNIKFTDEVEQDNTPEEYITTVEREKEKKKEALLATHDLVLRPALQPNKEYFKLNSDGSITYLGSYLLTTVPWEGVNKGTISERTFLHFSNLKYPIESSDQKEEFYKKCTPVFTLFWIEKIETLRQWIKERQLR